MLAIKTKEDAIDAPKGFPLSDEDIDQLTLMFYNVHNKNSMSPRSHDRREGAIVIALLLFTMWAADTSSRWQSDVIFSVDTAVTVRIENGDEEEEEPVITPSTGVTNIGPNPSNGATRYSRPRTSRLLRKLFEEKFEKPTPVHPAAPVARPRLRTFPRTRVSPAPSPGKPTLRVRRRYPAVSPIRRLHPTYWWENAVVIGEEKTEQEQNPILIIPKHPAAPLSGQPQLRVPHLSEITPSASARIQRQMRMKEHSLFIPVRNDDAQCGLSDCQVTQCFARAVMCDMRDTVTSVHAAAFGPDVTTASEPILWLLFLLWFFVILRLALYLWQRCKREEERPKFRLHLHLRH